MATALDDFCQMNTKVKQLAWLDTHLTPEQRADYDQYHKLIRDTLAERCGPNTMMACMPMTSQADITTQSGVRYVGQCLQFHFKTDNPDHGSFNIIMVLGDDGVVIEVLITDDDTRESELRLN